MTAPHVPMQRVREAVLRAVDQTSLRHVAREAGMSPPGLRHFMDGGEPMRPTARKLVEWYVREAAQRHELDEDTANAALSLLVERLPAAEAEDARERIRTMLRETYRKADTLPPDWLKG